MANVDHWKVSVQTIIRVLMLLNFIFEGTVSRIVYHGLKYGGENVCHKNMKVTYEVTLYKHRYTHKTTLGCCDLACWWRTCKRYKTYITTYSITGYRLRTDKHLVCCHGYRKRGSSCPIAICYQGCNNKGACVKHNKCRCTAYWTGPTCSEDINECQNDNGGCEQICVNKVGNPNACFCRKGYVQHPSYQKRCQDYDECRLKNMCSCAITTTNIDCGAKCTNTDGSFRCSCGTGYRLLGQTKCVDINECSINNGRCGEHRCINSPGSYSCLCTRGFRKENGRCKDVDECAANNGFCDKNRAICQNVRGSHRCRCKQGYILDGNRRTCSDIDECSIFHGCQQSCVNTIGGYYCSCSKGYKLANDKITCTDVDECAVQKISGTKETTTLAACEQICVNDEGSFHCACKHGYTLMYDRKRCRDIDECISGRHHCNQFCHNTDGSYRCSCSMGYKLAADGITCEGLPCEQIVSPHHGRMTCSGVVTNSTCSFSCNPGYSLTGSQKRFCQASSKWNGDRASCDAKHCKRLIPSVVGQSLKLPCFTSFSSNCYFECPQGSSMIGKGQASCTNLSMSGSVSWEISDFSCEEWKTCQPNPCAHGGKCKIQDQNSFSCDCEGTGYAGGKCQKGLVSTPLFPKLSIKSKSRTLSLFARPLKKLDVLLHSKTGVVFYPSSSREITFLETKQDFSVKGEKAGIHPISYTLGGPDKPDFEVPEKGVLFVEPRVLLLNESIYTKLSVPKRELPVGCNEYTYIVDPCELRFLSTDKWTRTPQSTKGIVHVKTPSNLYIPLSMIGFSLNELKSSRKNMIEKAAALSTSDKDFEVYYHNGDTCIKKESSSNNLLELIRDDALVTSFLQTFSKMAPGWLNFVTSELNDVFDIQNIVVSLAHIPPHAGEHCSGFPLSPSPSIVYFLPAVKYKIHVGQDEASLFGNGNTCFAADVCKQSIFISFSKQSANKLMDRLAVIRDMKDKGCNVHVDSVGVLEAVQISKRSDVALWNGTHYEQATPFNYNLWLKGYVTWNMNIPAMLDVTLDIKGESFFHSVKVDDLLIDRLSRPLEILFKGEGKYIVKARALRQDFTFELNSPEVIGKVRIGGPDQCEDRRQGLLVTFLKFHRDFFLKTPFHSYVRLDENERIDVITHITYNGGRQSELANMYEMRRIIRNIRYLVPDLREIFNDAISILPGEKDMLEKWTQTTESLNEMIGEFRRALSTRPVDINKIRKLTTETREKINILRKTVEVLKNRISLQAPASFLLDMIEDVQLGFPHSIPLRLRGESAQQRIHGIKIYFLCSLCMRKLCLNNVKAAIIYHHGNRCGSKQLPVRTFHVSGTTSKMMSLNPGKILTVLDGQSVNMAFARDSEHVAIVFEVQVRLLGLSQSTNATLDKTQLSLFVKGDMFNRYPAEMSVTAKIKEIEDWNWLVYLVEGKMTKSSLLPSYLQQEINKYINVTANNAQRRIQEAENAIRNAKSRTKEAENLLERKQAEMDIASKVLQVKMSNLDQTRAKYAQAKLRFNSSLMHNLNLENTTVCEMKNCKYLKTETCIPKLCRKEIHTTYTVPRCKEKMEHVTRLIFTRKEEVQSYSYTVPAKFDVEKAKKVWGVELDWKLKKKADAKTVTREYTKVTYAQEEKIEKIKSFTCASKPKILSLVTGHESPYECCNNDTNESILTLDPECISHNTECKWNLTEFAKTLTGQQDNESLLFIDYDHMTQMEWNVNITQMEVNLARTQFNLASNQVELARAFLLEQRYVDDSINITSIKIQEQLGLQLAKKMNTLGGLPLVSVERLSFSTSMTSTTKTLLPLVASVETVEGERRLIEFPMDFKRVNYSLASASKLVVKTLLGTANSRERRSTRIGLSNDAPGMDTGERMCFLSYQANAFFDDIIQSFEFFLEVTRELFQGLSLGLRGFDSHYEQSGGKPSIPSRQPLESLEELMRSLKSHYADNTREVTWDKILEQWRASLNVLTAYKNFTECSGSQDCVDYFFRTLDEFYLYEYGLQALEIKEHLQGLRQIFAGLLHQNLSFASAAQKIAPRAKALLNKTKDDSVLCGTGPIITESSPAEVVVLAGDTATLTCRVKSTSQVEVVWIKNERILDDMNDEELVLRDVNTETEGAYKCEASDKRGRAVSNFTIVKVHQAPTIIEHPGSMQVLTGTDTVLFVCNSAGVPQPSTDWFFTPMHEQDEVVMRLNVSKPVLTKTNLTSEDSGFYYCNVSNIHGTLQSRKARLDVVGFAPGTPRIVVSLSFAECPPEDLLESSPNCTEEPHNPPQHLDYAGLNQTFSAMVREMDWSWKRIGKIEFSLRPHASVSFLIQGSTPAVTSNVSPSYMDALDSYSVSHYELGKALKSFRSAVDAGTFMFPWKHLVIVAKKGSFAAELYTQKCPVGTEADKRGFICVNCPRGYYAAENGTCLQCPNGTYQPEERSTTCLKCPFILSLTQPGAVKESQCIDISIPCKPPNTTKLHVEALNESKNKYRTGDRVVLECKPGYRGIGNGTVECNEGNWTSQGFYCKKTCYRPWTELRKRCYQVVDVLSYKWSDAQAKCQSLSSQMMIISTEEENDFIAQLIKAHMKNRDITRARTWLGLSKVDRNAQFQWVDGAPLDGYTNWSSGEPNNDLGVELCTEMLVSGRWNDVRCITDYKALAVCEKPLRKGE